jgi:hypothetical protein
LVHEDNRPDCDGWGRVTKFTILINILKSWHYGYSEPVSLASLRVSF